MTPADMAKIHAAAFKQSRPWSVAEISDLLGSPLVRAETAAHGFALWRAIAGEAELLTIAVAPETQRRGIGTDLMRRFLQNAADMADVAFLEVAADNSSAIALYQRHGFAPSGLRKAYYPRPGGHNVDAIVMRNDDLANTNAS